VKLVVEEKQLVSGLQGTPANVQGVPWDVAVQVNKVRGQQLCLWVVMYAARVFQLTWVPHHSPSWSTVRGLD
jgi:hypothetical protein